MSWRFDRGIPAGLSSIRVYPRPLVVLFSFVQESWERGAIDSLFTTARAGLGRLPRASTIPLLKHFAFPRGNGHSELHHYGRASMIPTRLRRTAAMRMLWRWHWHGMRNWNRERSLRFHTVT